MASKKLITFLILAAILGGAFAPIFAEVVYANHCIPPAVHTSPTRCEYGAGGQQRPSQCSGLSCLTPTGLFNGLLSVIAGALLMIGAFFLSITGLLFDFVIDQTIVNMSANLATGAGGIGDGINAVWSTLRDLANMVFIFVLLWAAIQLILGLSTEIGKTIRNIIIVGLLINFSLFFTKVVIDASNIPAIGFLNSIRTATVAAPPTSIQGFELKSYAALVMNAVGLHTFFKADVLNTGDPLNIFMTGLMGLIMMLVLSVVFLVAGVLFVARYILLIMLMILSPLALIGYALPALKSKTAEWWQALKNQAFFAPYFMLMLWVAFKLMYTRGFISPQFIQGANLAVVGQQPQGTMGLILKFVLVIGMIVAALILSKKMASSTKGFGAIVGGVATVGFGTAGFAGRRTVGALASRVTKSVGFQRLAARHQKTFGALYSGTQKVAKSSFDVRGLQDTKIGQMTKVGTLTGDLGKVSEKARGGFEKYKEEKTKRIVEKGKSFTDRQARAEYARKRASGILTHRGSLPNNVNSMFGVIGSSNRMAAATLLDERIRELQTEMNQARGELNTLNNNMGFAPTLIVPTPTPAHLALLSPSEQTRYTTLTGPVGTVGSIATMGNEQINLRTDRTNLGLTNTLRQQF